MIDLSKLPAPTILDELDFEAILAAMRADLQARLPEWTASELEADPANKILEVAAYRELLLRQRVNTAARSVLVAFATDSDLDHLAAFYGVTRLDGARATFTADVTLSTILDSAVSVPAGFRLVATDGGATARLLEPCTISAGTLSTTAAFEIVAPAGATGNGLSLSWSPVTPLPFLTQVVQLAPSAGGSATEADADFRKRIPTSLERFSTAGPRLAYEYWAISADERIKAVRALSPEPGVVHVVVLSGEGDGTPDAAMLTRVADAVGSDDRRPLTDVVRVVAARIIPYDLLLHVECYPGVAPEPVLAEVYRKLHAFAADHWVIGEDVTRSAVMAAAHTEGVKRVVLDSPADLDIEIDEAPWCRSISVTWSTADGR